MDILDTSAHTKEESVKILSKELEKHPILILIGPQGGGKTTLAIQLLSENVGAYFEGRARAAQPVVLIRKDFVGKMKGELYERRKLPIFEGDEPVYVEVSVYDQVKLLVENVFDVMELGEPELIRQITLLTKKLGVVPKGIELTASDEELVKRRLKRHLDAKERLSTLLEKEKKYGIESNLLGIQGAKITDILHREGVADYSEDQISRTIKDFDRIIPTKGLTLKDCLQKMIEISNNENKESGFLVLHTDEDEKIISDLVVGKQTNSLIGVTLLEIYVGFRQNRSLYRAYKHEKEGKLEVIHSYTPTLQELEFMANPWIPPTELPIMSSADVAAAERFDVIVSVVEADGKVESSSKKRKKELEGIVSAIVGAENFNASGKEQESEKASPE
jgi:energy-coupling factor transporter ATP-binding protein EcfA2